MNLCKTCGTICPFDDEHEECDAYSPLTNFQRITASTEALADFIAWQLSQLNDIHECDIPIDADDNLFKKEFWLEWLKQESDENEMPKV